MFCGIPGLESGNQQNRYRKYLLLCRASCPFIFWSASYIAKDKYIPAESMFANDLSANSLESRELKYQLHAINLHGGTKSVSSLAI